MVETLLQIRNLSKKIGSKHVLNDINLEVGAGKIVGLLGSNGSGKTTLMKSIAGIMYPDRGDILLESKPLGIESKTDISFMPDFFSLERNMKIKEVLQFYSDFYSNFDLIKAKELLAFMRLDEQERVKSLSKGMNERLALVVTLGRDAKLYLLDEPIGGIDPVAREKILDAILNFYSPTSTIILSTHLIHDMESIFDEVAFLKQGKIVLHENVEDIRLSRKCSVVDLFKEVFAEC